jgi:hypothetical protein
MKKNVLLAAAVLMSVAFLYPSCKKKDDPAPAEETPAPAPGPTLYSRVGGTTMVADPTHAGMMIEQGRLTLRSVVDSSINVIAADPQLQPYFNVLFAELGAGNTSGLTALSLNFTDFMCSATGAGNAAYQYGGRSMKQAHDPVHNTRMTGTVNTADFDQFVNDIGIGLAKNGVNSTNNPQLVNDLVALLNTTRADIVQR